MNKKNKDIFFNELLPNAFMEGFTSVMQENVVEGLTLNSKVIKIYQQTMSNNYLKLHHFPMRRKKTGTRKLQNQINSPKKKPAQSLFILGRPGSGIARYSSFLLFADLQ